MRKKSHISLARDIVRNSEDEGLRKHKWAFYLGSILPDIPITRYQNTFTIIRIC